MNEAIMISEGEAQPNTRRIRLPLHYWFFYKGLQGIMKGFRKASGRRGDMDQKRLGQALFAEEIGVYLLERSAAGGVIKKDVQNRIQPEKVKLAVIQNEHRHSRDQHAYNHEGLGS
jgi:hypothetical protein